MDDEKKVLELSAAELLRLAAEKMGLDGESLSSLEVGLEDAARELGRLELERRLNAEETPGPKRCPRCGRRCRARVRAKERTLQTLSGRVTYRRNYHYCDDCSLGFYPRDEQYDIPKTGEVSSELERRILDFAMNDPFEQGAARYGLHYGSPVSANLLRQVFKRSSNRLSACDDEWIQKATMPPDTTADDTPVVVESDGSMVSTTHGWKEIKLGMVYRLKSPLACEKPHPPRFVASMEGTQVFEDALEQALTSHSEARPGTVLWLGDGAAGFWNIAKRVCPDAHQILDYYHAIEHAADCAKSLFDDDEGMQALWTRSMQRMLLSPEGIEVVLDDLEGCLFLADNARQRKALNDLRRYYRNHRHRMDYSTYQQRRWPIGSGSIESAHRYVLQKRMKLAGQHWAPKNANAMAKMRAAYITAGPARFHKAIADAYEETNIAV